MNDEAMCQNMGQIPQGFISSNPREPSLREVLEKNKQKAVHQVQSTTLMLQTLDKSILDAPASGFYRDIGW